jgi:CBS domain-containing protein
MRERRAGSVLVIDEQQRLSGIFTGRDAVRALAEGKDAAMTTLAQAMTPNPVTITPESRAIDALRTMSDGGFRHLPVVENERTGASSRAAISRGWRSINWRPPVGMHPLNTLSGRRAKALTNKLTRIA